jgi:hypothetical protein
MGREGRTRSLLGVLAYVVVPGERRQRAATYFRRAGIEAAKGVGALMRPERPPERNEGSERQSISID